MLFRSVNVSNWYQNIITLAERYDIENRNWINNNIPLYILNNENNASLLLFFSMIGQHFDNIYFHTKAIERSRGMGYKQSGNISDKLLFVSCICYFFSADPSLFIYSLVSVDY